MKKAALLLLLAWSGPTPAEEAKPPSSGGEKSAPAKPGLDERVALLASMRDPFWPPGYKSGGEPVAPANAKDPAEDLGLLAIREGARLNVQGRIKVGSKYLLMLQGRAVGQGDVINVTGENGKTFKMKILSISQDNIQLEPVGR